MSGLGTFRTDNRHSLLMFYPWFEHPIKERVRRLGKGDLFVDLGANIGMYSVMAARQGCTVMAFEPGDRAFSLLNANVAINGLSDRVATYKKAAWSESASLRLSRNFHCAMRQIGSEGDEVEGVALDDLIHPLWPPRKRVFVKADVEDSESKAFAGMQRMLARDHPEIVFEARSPELFAADMEVLSRFGYRAERLDYLNWSASASAPEPASAS